MICDISIDSVFSTTLTVIDVRSPGEFIQGHIPGAKNIPLFTDEERAIVGTIYKQKSEEAAVEKGYELVTPKFNDFVLNSKIYAPNLKVVIHCERGGMRSRSFAQLLSDNGFKEVYIITDGYKSFRRYAIEIFSKPLKIKLLGGYTGSGKTHILHELQKSGSQIIDLERLANHKGSTFGGLGQSPQPSVEQFGNNLCLELLKLNYENPVWIEDESHNIGRIEIPHEFFSQMEKSDLYFLEIPKTERAKHLVKEYAGCATNLLKDSVLHISKRLGGQNVKTIMELLDNENFFEVALMTLDYYDKLYLKSLNNKSEGNIIRIPVANVDIVSNSEMLRGIS